MIKHRMVKDSGNYIVDLTSEQQRLVHGGIYLLNRKGAVAIDDGNHSILLLPGYDLVSLGQALMDAGVPVVKILQVVNDH